MLFVQFEGRIEKDRIMFQGIGGSLKIQAAAVIHTHHITHITVPKGWLFHYDFIL